jgi:hypothetical protein
MTTTATAPTEAKGIATEGGHWYAKDGTPAYQQPNKSKPGEFRNTTLRDAKKLGLLPGVTTITKLLHSEGLMRWRINEAATALMTSPRREGEGLDAFIERVLWVDREHEATAKAARDLGTEVHTAIELCLMGKDFNHELDPYVIPAVREVGLLGMPLEAEKVVVGDGYAGKMDLMVQARDEHGNHGTGILLVDYKTAKKLPEKPYNEHLLQLSAYCKAAQDMGFTVIGGVNVYVSTTEPGKVLVPQPYLDWATDYQDGFLPLVRHWQWANDYRP